MDITPADIRAMMATFGWNQKDLTRRLGCGEGTVSHWLAGRREPKGLLARELTKLIAQSKLVGEGHSDRARREELRAMVIRIVAATIPEPPDDATPTHKAFIAGQRLAAETILTSQIEGLWLATSNAMYEEAPDGRDPDVPQDHEEEDDAPASGTAQHPEADEPRRLSGDAD